MPYFGIYYTFFKGSYVNDLNIEDLLDDSSEPSSKSVGGSLATPGAAVTDPKLKPPAKKNGRPFGSFQFDTPQELQELVDKYFSTPESKPWTMSGLALALNIDRGTLLDYKNRNGYGKIVNAAKAKIEVQVEQMLLTKGGPNPAGVIFNLANNYKEHWHQKQEQDIQVSGKEGAPKISVVFTSENPNK